MTRKLIHFQQNSKFNCKENAPNARHGFKRKQAKGNSYIVDVLIHSASIVEPKNANVKNQESNQSGITMVSEISKEVVDLET